MIEKTKRGEYIVKMAILEKKILSLEKELNENFEQSSLYFDLCLPVTKEMIKKTDKLGADLNKAITDFRYYNMLLQESEDFSFNLN
jgi:hypothetical protein